MEVSISSAEELREYENKTVVKVFNTRLLQSLIQKLEKANTNMIEFPINELKIMIFDILYDKFTILKTNETTSALFDEAFSEENTNVIFEEYKSGKISTENFLKSIIEESLSYYKKKYSKKTFIYNKLIEYFYVFKLSVA